MPKLTNYTFVEIFDERKGAGQAQVSIGRGKLPMKETVAVISHVTGLYCAEMRMLLIEFKQYRVIGQDFTEEVKGCGAPYVKAVREISVTNSVRDLPEMADEWHNLVHDAVVNLFPDLNEGAEEMADDDSAKYRAEFVAAVEALAPQAGEGVDTIEISSHGTGDDKKVVLKAKGATK